jgi:sugar phosphate isomerase/epimerase
MAVENMPWRDQGMLAPDRTMPGASVPQIIGLIEGLGDHVGICLDVGHSNVVGLSAAQEALDGGALLFCLHIQDNDGLGQDQHLLPGEGTINWSDFLIALDTLHFAGMRTFEVLRGHEPDLLLQGMADLAKAWAG